MSIRSYLVHTVPGERDRVADLLRLESGCAVWPAENRDVIVVVAAAASRDAEAALDARLAALPGVTTVALVAGFAD
jgi:nitrate reductase NapAB chaperone NapD